MILYLLIIVVVGAFTTGTGAGSGAGAEAGAGVAASAGAGADKGTNGVCRAGIRPPPITAALVSLALAALDFELLSFWGSAAVANPSVVAAAVAAAGAALTRTRAFFEYGGCGMSNSDSTMVSYE